MVSAVVIAKNEEKDIEKCLNSLKWCDERIVIDNDSEDATSQLAQKTGATVISSSIKDDFAALRNLGLSHANSDWVLYVDGDELVSQSLAFEITSELSRNLENYSGFYISRIDILWGKELAHGENKIKLLRLGKKDKGVWEGEVHEVWNIKGKIGMLKNPIMHAPHMDTGDFWERIDFYSTIRAKELFKKKKRAGFFSILFYPMGKFVQDYIVKRGFLDGVPGFLVAINMSFHSFLTRGKLWLLWNKK